MTLETDRQLNPIEQQAYRLGRCSVCGSLPLLQNVDWYTAETYAELHRQRMDEHGNHPCKDANFTIRPVSPQPDRTVSRVIPQADYDPQSQPHLVAELTDEIDLLKDYILVLQQRLAQQSNEPTVPEALSIEQQLVLEMFISPSQATKTETISPDQTRNTPQ